MPASRFFLHSPPLACTMDHHIFYHGVVTEYRFVVCHRTRLEDVTHCLGSLTPPTTSSEFHRIGRNPYRWKVCRLQMDPAGFASIHDRDEESWLAALSSLENTPCSTNCLCPPSGKCASILRSRVLNPSMRPDASIAITMGSSAALSLRPSNLRRSIWGTETDSSHTPNPPSLTGAWISSLGVCRWR